MAWSCRLPWTRIRCHIGELPAPPRRSSVLHLRWRLGLECLESRWLPSGTGLLDPLMPADQPARLLISGYPSPTRNNVVRTFVVSAVDALGNVVPDYTGIVTFTSDDPTAILPPSYTFTPGDGGARIFQATFPFSGVKSLHVSDGVATGLQEGIAVTRTQPPAGSWFIPVSNKAWTGTVGTFTNPFPGAKPEDFHITLDWGDDTTPGQNALLSTDDGTTWTVTGTHTYGADTNYQLKVTVTHLPTRTVLPVAPTAAAALTATQEDALRDASFIRETTSAQLNANLDAVRARLTQPTANEPDATVFVAVYAGNPQPSLGGVVFFDVRVTDADSTGNLVARLRHPDFASDIAELLYFDPETDSFRPVLGSTVVPQSLVADDLQDLVTITFDETSRPRLSELTGTVFTVGVKATSSGGSTGVVGPPVPEPDDSSGVTVPVDGDDLATTPNATSPNADLTPATVPVPFAEAPSATPSAAPGSTSSPSAGSTGRSTFSRGSSGGFFVLTLSASQESTLTASAAALRGESAADIARGSGAGGFGEATTAASSSTANSGGAEDAESTARAPGGPSVQVPGGQGGSAVAEAVFGVWVGDVARTIAARADDLLGDAVRVLASQARQVPDLLARSVLSLVPPSEAAAQLLPPDLAAPPGSEHAIETAHKSPLPPLPPWSQVVATIPPAFATAIAHEVDSEDESENGILSWPLAIGTVMVLTGSGALLAHRRRWI